MAAATATVRQIDSRRSSAVDMTELDRRLTQPTVEPPPTPGPTEAETMAHTAADGVNVANTIKTNINRMLDAAEVEFESLRKDALAFVAETAERQAKLQERITRFTDDCMMLRKGVDDVYKKLGERTQQQ